MTNAEGKWVLVADDDRNSLDLISTLLEYAGYQSIVASNGKEAVEKFAACREQILLVLLDALMPQMDGFEASAEIRRMAGESHIPIIFITSLSKKDQVVRCLSMGDDIITKPFNHEILNAKVKVHSRISDLYRKVQQQNRQLSFYQQQIEMEHEVTEHIFGNFLSIGIAESENTRSYSSPLSRFNGDVLLVTPALDGSLYFFIGDVTGHGLPAAVSSVPASCAFQSMAKKGLSVGAIAREMNKYTRKVMPLNMMMAGIIGRLESNGCELQLWAGGMPDIVHVDENGRLLDCIESWHLPLGIEEDESFQCDVKVLRPPLNSRLIMYTDGIIESRNKSDEMFGESRFLAACQRPGGSPFDAILAAATEFRQSKDQSDDVTLLELVFKPFVALASGQYPPADQNRKTAVPWVLTAKIGLDEIVQGAPVAFLAAVTRMDERLACQSGIFEMVVMDCFNYCLERSLLRMPAALSQQSDKLLYFNERKRRIAQLDSAEIFITLEIGTGAAGAVLVVEIENRGGAADIGSADCHWDDGDSGEQLLQQVKTVATEVEIKNAGTSIRAVIDAAADSNYLSLPVTAADLVSTLGRA